MKWIRYTAISALSFLLLSGCVAIMGTENGAQNVRYKTGALVADLEYGIDKVVNATSMAIDTIGYSEKTEAVDAMNAVLTAKTAKGEKVTFRIDRVTDTSSTLKIRIGKMGDAQRSIMVFETIQNELK
jgi:hypothetical protein